MKLNVKAFALTTGIIAGLGLFLVTWWLIVLNGSSDTKTVIGAVYIGYRLTPLGSFIGLAYAFVDGVIFGAVFAWLYNKLSGNK